MPHQLRIARPVANLVRTKAMYCEGLGLRVLGSFENHQGFDGIVLGVAGADYHFEFTYRRCHPVKPEPTVEDLLVLYISSEHEWKARCAAMTAAGFEQVASFNPYWAASGRTFEDLDGYRIVLQRAELKND